MVNYFKAYADFSGQMIASRTGLPLSVSKALALITDLSLTAVTIIGVCSMF